MLNSSRKAVLPVPKHISAAFYSTTPQDPGRFKFAAAASDATNLYRAIGECVQQVHEALGNQSPPSLLQLFVTTAHRSRLAHAPECTLRKLKERNDAPPPLLIGGALQAVSGPSGLIPAGVPGVSLLACHLPGVQLWPFHTEHTSLPQLTPQAWKALLETTTTTTTTTNAAAANQHAVSGASAASNPSSSSSTGGAIQQQPQAAAAAAGVGPGVVPCIRQSSGAMCLLLSSPQFASIEQLLQRLTSLLPHVPVIGGVTEPDAWVDTEHNFGALFIRDKVVCTGAVGTFLRGPLTLTQLTAPSYRPVGSPAVVTSAAGNLILGLDGGPVHEVFPQMYGQLAEEERRAEVALGVEVMGSPGEWVTRGVSLTMGPDGRPVLAVAVAEVPPGVAVQLQVRDPAYQQQQWQAGVYALAEAGILPAAATGAAAARDLGGTATAATAPAAAATGHIDIGGGAGAGAAAGAGCDVAALDFTCVAVQQHEVEEKEAAAAAGAGGGGGGGGSQCLEGVALAGGRMQGEFGRISSSSWMAPGSAAAAQGEADKTAAAAQQQHQQQQHQGGGWLHSFVSSLSLLAHDPHWPGE